MKNVLKFKDVCDIKLIEEKYINTYNNVDIHDYMNKSKMYNNKIAEILREIEEYKYDEADDYCHNLLITLREILEEYKQLYLNTNLDFEDTYKDDILRNMLFMHNYVLRWIDRIDNLIIDNNDN